MESVAKKTVKKKAAKKAVKKKVPTKKKAAKKGARVAPPPELKRDDLKLGKLVRRRLQAGASMLQGARDRIECLDDKIREKREERKKSERNHRHERLYLVVANHTMDDLPLAIFTSYSLALEYAQICDPMGTKEDRRILYTDASTPVCVSVATFHLGMLDDYEVVRYIDSDD